MKQKLAYPEINSEVTRNHQRQSQRSKPKGVELNPESKEMAYDERDYALAGQEDDGGAWAHQREIERQQQDVLHHEVEKAKTNYFAELAKLDVSEHVEKKGPFSYLSWAWAVDHLRRVHPDATWEVKRFDGAPYLRTDCGYFVEVAVTVNGITLSQVHPVLDAQNKPVQVPNAFHINTSIQRCLVKAIALHGLGLYIYAGEDLPVGAEPAMITEEQQAHVGQLIEEIGGDLKKFLSYFKIEKLADLPAENYERAVAALEKKKKAAA